MGLEVRIEGPWLLREVVESRENLSIGYDIQFVKPICIPKRDDDRFVLARQSRVRRASCIVAAAYDAICAMNLERIGFSTTCSVRSAYLNSS